MTNPAQIQSPERPLLIGIRDAARLLGISPGSVRKLADTGALETARLGRRRMVPRAALERLASAGTAATQRAAA